MNSVKKTIFKSFINQCGLSIIRDSGDHIWIGFVKTSIFFENSHMIVSKIDLHTKTVCSFSRALTNQKIAQFLKDLTEEDFELQIRSDNPTEAINYHL